MIPRIKSYNVNCFFRFLGGIQIKFSEILMQLLAKSQLVFGTIVETGTEFKLIFQCCEKLSSFSVSKGPPC